MQWVAACCLLCLHQYSTINVPPYTENRTVGGLEFILYTEMLQILTLITSLYQPPQNLFLSISPGAFPLRDK